MAFWGPAGARSLKSRNRPILRFPMRFLPGFGVVETRESWGPGGPNRPSNGSVLERSGEASQKGQRPNEGQTRSPGRESRAKASQTRRETTPRRPEGETRSPGRGRPETEQNDDPSHIGGATQRCSRRANGVHEIAVVANLDIELCGAVILTLALA